MSQILLEKVKSHISDSLKNFKLNSQPMAVFDADGTLWALDVGRNFFQYQIQNKLFNISNPAQQFETINCNEGRKKALQWLARLQAGTPLKTMQKWVKDFLTHYPPQAFLFQQELIKWLKLQKVQVFVVSSSLKWVLDIALKIYDLTPDCIIGVETAIKNHCITNNLITPAPVQEDKVSALKKISPIRPIFCAGNTLSDQYLLEWSSSTKLVVSSAKQGEKNYLSEQKLLTIAKQNKWFYLEVKN